MLTVAQTTENIRNFMVGKWSLQEISTSLIIREISDSNLETGRVDSTGFVPGERKPLHFL